MWNLEDNHQDIDFSIIHILVQKRGISLKIKAKHIGQNIESKLGLVIETDIYSYHKKATLVKVRIFIDVTKSLKPNMYIGSIKDGTI